MTTTKWAIDPTHSEIGFKVKHMMFTNVSGKFENYDANITTEDDDFSKASIEFSADINSIDTRNADRDNHLKSADFFDAENHPKMTFKASSFTKVDDENYELLQENLRQLKSMRLLSGKQLNIIELPMPDPVIWEDQRLPASYGNFYICNKYVIVPTFRSDKDDKVCNIIQNCFPSHEVVGIDSTDIIWGLGSFHCLSQQEPAI